MRSTYITRLTRPAVSLVLVLAAFFAAGCNLFNAGLGAKVDIAEPVVAISSPANGQYMNGPFSLQGSVSDDLGVKSVGVVVSFSAETGLATRTFAATVDGSSWKADLDAAALAPGTEANASIVVTATDVSSKTSERKIILYLDNKAPTVRLSSPTAEDLANTAQLYNGSVVLKGSSDTDVADLILEAGGRAFRPTPGNNASFRIQVDTALLGDGDHDFRLWAVDNAGNTSVESAGTLRVAQASDLPVLSFKGAEADVIDLSDTSRDILTNRNVFARGLTINGTLSDDDGLDLSSLRLVLKDPVTGDTVATWQRGDPTYNISVKALGSNTDPAYSSYVTSATLAFTIPATFSQGIYKLSGTVSDSLGAKAAPLASSGLPAPSVAVDSFSDIYFVVDDGKPTAVITSLAPTQKTFSAAGTAEAGLGVRGIEYQLDGTAEGSWTFIESADKGPLFSWSIPTTALGEKAYKLYVRPISTGNVRGPVVSGSFNIDTTLPLASIQALAPSTGSESLKPASFPEISLADAPGGVLATVNGKVRFRGIASDKALASVSWAISHVASTASSPWTLDGSSLAEGSFAAATMSDWSLVVDTSAAPYADGQSYTLAIKALDEAGNEFRISSSFLVDQATDKPGLDYLSMKTTGVDAATAKLNLLGVNDLVLTATLVDDDRVDPDSLLLSFNGGAAVPVTGNQASSGALTINQSLDSLPEGRNWFTLSFTDLGSWKHGLAPVQTVVGPIWFVVDTVQPQMAYDAASTAYNLGNSHLTIGGTISTANGLDPDATLVLKIGGSPVTLKLGAEVTVKSTGTPNVWNWSHEFDASALADGLLAIRATAKDEFGLPGSMDFQVTVDKTPPILSASNPLVVFSPRNGRLLFGPAQDATTGVASIEAVILDAALAVVDPALAPISLNLDAATPGSAGGGWTLDTTGLATGSYTISISAKDKTGNTAALAPFVVKVDQEAPVATIDAIPGSLVDSTLYCSLATVMPAAWSGQASDPFLSTATLKVDQAAPVAVNLAGPAWSLPLDWASLGQGRHELLLTVTDLGGFTSTASAVFVKDTLAPELVLGNISQDGSTVILDAQTTKLTGSLTDATALASATVTLAHSPDGGSTWAAVETGVSLGSPANAIWNFSKDLTGPAFAADGLWRISVTAADSLGNSATSAPVIFRLDRVDPVLGLDALAATVLNRGFPLSGTASSANLGGISWWIDAGGPTALPGPFPGDSAYAIALVRSDAEVGALSEGSHTISFQATSLGGRQAQKSLSFRLDRTAPTVAWSNILESGTSVLQAPSPQVLGTAKDDNGVALVERKVERWTGGAWVAVDLVPADGFVPMVSLTGQIYTWTADLSNSSSFPDGKYRMTLRTTDVASPANLALSVPVVFYLDRALPTVAIDSPASGTSWNQALALAGSAADANLTELSASLDGSTALAVTGLEAWTLDLPAPQVLALPEGSHAITIRSKDVAGNLSIPQTFSFRVDRSGPVVSRSSILLGGGSVIQDATPSLSGTLGDPSGLAGATASLERYDYSLGTWSTLAGWNAASLGVSGSPTSYDWVIDLSSEASYPDGRYRLSLGATDTSQPANSMAQGPVMFMLSRANPQASVAGPAMGSYQNAGPVFWGRSSDANGILGVEAKAGSGGSVSFASGTTPALAGVPVSLDPGTDTFTTAKAQGFQDGDLVYLAYDAGGSLPGAAGTGISSSTAYHVVQVGVTSFRLSLTAGGAAIDFSSSGSTLIAASSRLAWGDLSPWWFVAALDLGGAADGSLTAWVQAQAGSGKTAVASRDFTLDATNPSISLSSPSSGSRSVGNLVITGTSTDPGSSPSGMSGGILYQVGRNANLGNLASWTNASVTGGSYSWSIYLGDMSAYANATWAVQCDPSGNPSSSYNLWRLPIYFRAQDNAGNIGLKTDWWLILDPDGNIPSVSLTQPTQNGLSYGGQQRISGTASQPTWVHDVQVCIDPTNSGNYPNTPASTLNAATGVFTSVSDHGLGAGKLVFIKGEVLPKIGGVAVNPGTPYYVLATGLTASSFMVSDSPGGAAVSFSSAGGTLAVDPWQDASLMTTGTSVIWYCDINKGSVYPESGYTSQTVGVQARAWNAPTAGGARGSLVGYLASPLTMTFNSTFPKLEDIYLSPTASTADPEARTYYSQISARASFYVLATVSSTKGITRIEKVENSPLSGSTVLYDSGVSYGATATVSPQGERSAGSFSFGSSYQLIITSLGSTDWQGIGAPAGAKVGSVFSPTGPGSGTGTAIMSDSTGAFKYKVAIPLDSTTVYPSTTGVYSFDIRSTDMTSTAQVSTQTITINEDNFYPSATIATSASVVGSQFLIQGGASDIGSGSGTIAGFKSLEVYLVRASSIVNLLTGGTSAAGTIVAKDGALASTATFPYPASLATGTRAIIDDLLENNSLPSAGGNDRNGDGLVEYLGLSGTTYNWAVQVDSTVLGDGPATLHYIACDSVGNRTHYSQSVYIRNNAPSISQIALGTDLNGDSTIGDVAGEAISYSPAAFAATGFVARNHKLSLSILTTGGNGRLQYSVRYPDAAGTELVVVRDAGSLVTGRLYRIAVLGASPAFVSAGAASNTVDQLFVATGPGSGTGTAWEVSDSTATTLVTAGLYYYIAAPGSDASSFGAGANSPGTLFTATATGTLSGGGVIQVETLPSSTGSLGIYDFPGLAGLSDSSLPNDRSFHVRVYDSTPGTSPGVDSLEASATVGLAIHNQDLTVPTVTMAQLYWNSATDNSLYASSQANGHLDFGTLTGATGALADSDPRISGKVRYEGLLSDDQRIQYVRMRITSATGGFDFAGGTAYGAWHDVAAWNPVSKALEGRDEFVSLGWKFSLSGETIGSAGHSAAWKLEWDSARIKNGADTDLQVQIQVQDFRNPGIDLAGTSNSASASRQADVVPYILDISRPLPFVDRLAEGPMNPGKGGYYPLLQGATGIVVTGFNLLSSSSQTLGTNAITVGTTILPITAGSWTGRDSLTVSIPPTLVSSGGVANATLKVTTNGLESINGVNDLGQAYNSSNPANGDSTAANANRRLVYIDEEAPTLAIAPFGQKYPVRDRDDSTSLKDLEAVSDYTDNVPYTGTDKTAKANWLGHVEYDGSSVYGVGMTDVSGQVTFRGKAADNQRIGSITVTIPTLSASLSAGTDTFSNAGDNGLSVGSRVYFSWTTAPTGATNGRGPYYVVGSPTATAFQVSATKGGAVVNFTGAGAGIAVGGETPIYTLAGGATSGSGWTAAVEGSDYGLSAARVGKGHVLNWTFTWSSWTIPGAAQSSVPLTFSVYDATTDALSSSQTMVVDVVPYITAITTKVTGLLSADFARSANGRYPIFLQSTGTAAYETVALTGFNLAPTATGVGSDVRISKDADAFDATWTTRQGTGLAYSGAASPWTSLSVTVQAAGSGYLTVIANGVPSINSIDDDGAAYNQQASTNNTTLRDNTYLSLWDFNPLRSTVTSAKNAVYPSMVISGNTPQFAYENNSGGYGIAYFLSGGTATMIYQNWDLFTYTALALNGSGNRAALYDINVVNTANSNYPGNFGGIMANFFYAPAATTSPTGTSTYYYKDYNLWLDNLYKAGNNAVMDRYQYPDIKMVGTTALSHVFYSVYDGIDDKVIFRYFRLGTDQAQTGGATNGKLITDNAANKVYLNQLDMTQVKDGGGWPTWADNGTRWNATSTTAGATSAGLSVAAGTGVGIYSAVAGISTGPSTARAILVYYSNNILKYAYATDDTNTSFTTVDLATNVGGDYVSMVLDASNHVHIAYNDSYSGDVRYVYIPTYDVPDTRTSVKVDSYLTVGEKLALGVNSSGTPYITYRGLGNTARVAWLSAALGDGTDSLDKYNGTWEVQTLPTKIVDSDTNRFCIGVGTNGLPVIGYSNNDSTKKGIEYLTGLSELAN